MRRMKRPEMTLCAVYPTVYGHAQYPSMKSGGYSMKKRPKKTPVVTST